MKHFIISILLFLSGALFSQVTNEGMPKSWEYNIKANLQTITLPSFNLKALEAEDAINDLQKDIPYRFGKKFDTNYNLDNSGVWTVLPNGDRIWQIAFESEGAQTLNFILTNFEIPKHSTIYLYNEDKSDLLGAYTSKDNNEAKTLGTWLVKGQKVWIEYYETAKESGLGHFTISHITHGYRSDKTLNKAINDSGHCNLDVNCPIGADLDPHKDLSKKATALLISGGSSFCTGSLVNNTANDGKPYILTANHCYSNPAAWSFRFNWISTNTVCAGTGNNVSNTNFYTISGATLRARRTESDFCLVEINNPIPTTWDRTWMGWDRSNASPTSVYGTHHPSGDIMKTCRDSNPVSTNYTNGQRVWRINDWEQGVTEGGSSGSPLYNQEGRLIGQLWRGTAACAGTNDNGGYDEYGRFNISWDAGGTAATQLKNWLDPSNSGVNTTDVYPSVVTYDYNAGVSITNVEDVICGNSITPTIQLKNYGNITLTSATIQHYLNNNTPTVINWTGSLTTGQSTDIVISPITITDTDTSFNCSISNPNGQADQFTNNDVSNKNFEMAPSHQTTSLNFNLIPDNYGTEITWEFTDSSGTVLYAGGPYTNNNSTPINQVFTINDTDCYTFSISDSEGDGICCGFGIGSYSLKLADNTTVIASGGDYGAGESHQFRLGQNLGTEDIDVIDSTFRIYPNPSKGIFTIHNTKLSVKTNLEVYTVDGKLIQNSTQTESEFQIDLTHEQKGVYILRLTPENSESQSFKLIKN